MPKRPKKKIKKSVEIVQHSEATLAETSPETLAQSISEARETYLAGKSEGLCSGIIYSHAFWIVVLIGAAAIWGR